jgi:hypothetical protein
MVISVCMFLGRSYREFIAAAVGYRPQVLPCRGVLFVSRDDWQSKAYSQLDDSLGASGLFSGGMEVLNVPGDHVTVLDELHLSELAHCFHQALQKL